MDLEEAEALAVRLRERRAEARAAAWDAVGLLRARLREALGGEVLRGLVDLHPQGERWSGARLKHRGAHGIDAFLREDGREALCLDVRGEMVVASARAGARVSVREVGDGDVLAEDLEVIVRSTRAALERHVAHGQRTLAGYAAVAALAARLAGVLTPAAHAR